MVLTKDDFMKLVKERVGEDSSEQALKFIEDMTDTFNDLENKAKTENKKTDEEWQKELDEQDKAWRERYKERFFSGVSSNSNNEDDLLLPKKEEPKPEETVSYDDLFEEKEKK